ncbi:MAG: valine--tRNA ligase [Rickettsiales bacterium]
MTPLPEQYDTAAIEKKWQQHWLNHKTYAWDANESRENSYVIDTPPPTVSGTLHMGHVFSYTQADFIARFQRMTGKNVFYPMGFDDNGLPTERLVEKTKKIRAVDMSREDFINVCLGVSEEARKEFRALFESIALSVDWAQEYHTISDSSRRLSQLSFLDLVQKGHCYRALRPFYWDPVDQTAIAQAEIVDKEMASFQNTITFAVIPAKAGIQTGSPIDSSFRWNDAEKVSVMTTRPELLPACVALMCHPDDAEKYKGMVAVTPLFQIAVPIIADEKVDKEKGTGLVMCCTFGDDTDKEWWDKHKLQTRVILNKYGKLDEPALRGIGIAEHLVEELKNKKTSNPDPKNLGARETIIALLKESGLLTEQKPITHAVKCAERSGAALEILPSEQWFVRVMDKKDALTAKAKECNWNPEWMRVRMEQWIEGLSQDWCVSRQRYFGVPFPVWYSKRTGEEGKLLSADADQLPVNPLADLPKGYTRDEVTPDMDVMDTWATSSISPQLSAHAINGDSDRFAKLFPADLRPQAHEIIRTWAFYTVVKAHLHSNSIPWKNLMISGWCLAEDKSKMSKSKGNVVTPVALIEEKGTDAVRYWAATSRLGQDTAFSPDLLKIGKKLVGKLWNATAFAAIHLNKMTDAPKTAATDEAITEVFDKWILARLGTTVRTATEAFTRYEYAVALEATNSFFWEDFCDNYLELIKKRVYNEEGSFTAAQQQSAIRALYYCLNTILKLYAPFVPHVTEELYSNIFAGSGSIHACNTWPSVSNFKQHDDSDAINIAVEGLGIINEIRRKKSDAKVSIKFPVKLLNISFSKAHAEHQAPCESMLADIKGAGNVEEIAVNYNMSTEGLGFSQDTTLAEQSDAA